MALNRIIDIFPMNENKEPLRIISQEPLRNELKLSDLIDKNLYSNNFFQIFKGSLDEILENPSETLINVDPSSEVVAAMKSPQTAKFLLDGSKPVMLRSTVLSRHLRNCFSLMQREFPAISGLGNDDINMRIGMARMDDDYNNCNSALVFGALEGFSSSTMFGTMFHELAHNVLIRNYSFIPIDMSNADSIQVEGDAATIHEFVSDVTTFAMYSRLAGDDSKLFNQWLDEYMEFSKYEEESGLLSGRSFECHHAARTLIANIIREARANDVDLQKLFPEILNQSLGVISELRSPLEQPRFIDFSQMLIERINLGESLPGKEIQIVFSKNKDLFDNSPKTLLTYIDQMDLGIRVPEIKIVNQGSSSVDENIVSSLEQLLLRTRNSSFFPPVREGLNKIDFSGSDFRANQNPSYLNS